MSWIIFAIFAAFLGAVTNIIDKYILTKVVRKPLVPVLIIGILGLIYGIIIFLVRGFGNLTISLILIGLLSGIFYTLTYLFYFKAVKVGEISRIAIAERIKPLLVLLLATLFLGEILAAKNYLGIILIFFGTVLISFRKGKKLFLEKGMGYRLLSCIFFAVAAILGKYLLNFTDYFTVFAYMQLGIFLTLLLVFNKKFSLIVETAKESGKKGIGMIVISQILGLLSVFLAVIATSKGPVSIVSAFISIQPLFVLFLVFILSWFYPSIIKEELSGKAWIIKFISVVLIVMGVVLIS
ncbi:MAG: EamA family transporter [Candidatus Pacearchaeota archaeon]|nr:EamA family transporter [Candidatus Pacearchaeota archaeon]